MSHNPKITAISCDTTPTNAEYPLVVKTSGDTYFTDMRDYTGSNFTRIISLDAYKSPDITVASSFSPQSSSLATFTECPSRVVYVYDLGYTGSADIARTMIVTLTGSGIPQEIPVPTPTPTPTPISDDTTSGDNSPISRSSGGGCDMGGSVLCVLAVLGLALRKS